MNKGDTTVPIKIYKNLVRKYQNMVKAKGNLINKMAIIIEEKNVTIKLMNDYLNLLIYEGLITKKEVGDAIKSKKYSKELVKKQREIYCSTKK